MELSKFLQLLYRRKLLLILIPVITIIITFFLTRNLPDSYLSTARIATGIVDQSQQFLDNGDNVQESKINQDFANLVQIMRLKKMLDQVSYRLILHDLTAKKPFRKPGKLLQSLNADARKHAVEVYTNRMENLNELSLIDGDERGLYEVLKSMKYDDQSLLTKLAVYRVENSDFIDVQFKSENPGLSAFVVNTLCKEFITYYSSVVKENQHKAVNFFGKLLQEKKEAMDSNRSELRFYKIKNHILNLNEQAKSLYFQIADYETRKETSLKNIDAYTGAIKKIEDKFAPRDRKYLESASTKINAEILNTKDQLRLLNDNYIQSGFNEQYKISIDSLNNVLTSQINRSTDDNIFNPLAAKQSLVSQKLQMEINRDIETNSINSIDKELVRLNSKFDHLVPHEAEIQSYENAIDVTSREYLEILNRYNQTSLTSSFSLKIRLIQMAMPESAQPSKKMLLVILSGIISFVFCLVVLFVLFYLDNSIQFSRDLANKTAMPVLGHLNLLSGSMIDFNKIWSNGNTDLAINEFKNLLRSARFEIDHELHDKRILAVTSLTEGEGKSFFAISLAYAYAMTNKRILLIDGNFQNPYITQTVKGKLYIEDYLTNYKSIDAISSAERIHVIGNKGQEASLFELANETLIHQKLNLLAEYFDIIIIETAPLNALNKSKEWLLFADKVVGLFGTGQSLNEDKEDHIEYLKTLNGKFIGWVLNKVATLSFKTQRKTTTQKRFANV